MCDGPGRRHANGDLVSTADRLVALDAYNTARRDLAWSGYDKIDIPAASATMPQFSDGLVVSSSRDKRSLTVHRLPSKLRGLEARSWTLAFDFPIAHFTFDASQDLLVLIPIRATTSPSQWYARTDTPVSFVFASRANAYFLKGANRAFSSARSRMASPTRSPIRLKRASNCATSDSNRPWTPTRRIYVATTSAP